MELAITQPTPLMLLQTAVDKGADLSQLEKLMDLQERWEKKEAKKAFFEALSMFQSRAPTLKKSKVAKVTSAKGSFSYRYADLGEISAQIKGALTDCGLSYRWEFNEQNGKMRVTCHVTHKDGHSEGTTMEAGLDDSGAKNAIQQKGSTHTYLQRYTLIGALGLSTAAEDTDGKGENPKQPEKSKEDVIEQWQAAVSQTKTRVELTALYMKNKKAVDSMPEVIEMFTKHKNTLPETQKAQMP